MVVKYSFQDCQLCNLGIRVLPKISVDAEITIVFKEQEDKEDTEPVQEQIGKLFALKRHKFVLSDSLFYAHDLSNFSRVLVVDSSKLLYAGDLKNFSVRNVNKLCNDKEPGSISSNSIARIRAFKSNLYLRPYKKPYILVVDTGSLLAAVDTIRFDLNKIRTETYKAYYGDSYKQKLTEFDSLSLQPMTGISQFSISENGLYGLARTNIVNKRKDGREIKGVLSLCKFNSNTGTEFLGLVTNRGKDGKLLSDSYPTDIWIAENKERFYISIIDNDPTDTTSVIAELSLIDGRFVPTSRLPYYLPKSTLDSKLGTFMFSLSSNGSVVSNMYSNKFYDLETKSLIHLPDLDDSAVYTKEKLMSKNFMLKFRIIDFEKIDDKLLVSYLYNSKAYVAGYAIRKGAVTPLFKNEVLGDMMRWNPYTIAPTRNGYYVHDWLLKKISFFDLN